MPKATLIINVDSPEDARVLETWIETWTPHLAYLSDNLGCGCCVDIFNVEASQDALGELPKHLLANSEWTR